MISQSSILALGTNFLRASILSFLDIKTCSIEYLISDVFFMPANSIVDMLFNLRCLKKSKFDPFFKNRSEEHTSELQSRGHLVCRLLLEKKNELSAGCH